MMERLGGSYLIVVCMLGFGCRSLPEPGTNTQAATPPQVISSQVSSSSDKKAAVVTHLPKQPDRFSTCEKINPIWWFGNADEPVAPDWYRPGKRCRDVMWHLRNPCHNFNCYVIGLSDKPFTRRGRFPADTFNPNGGWNWAVCRYKRLRLPFISYTRGSVRAYCGWRAAGAFGIELKLAAKKEVPVRRPNNSAESAQRDL
jgi:hypothetical protein